MKEQPPTPRPTEWHRYVDDNGNCAVCGITAGILSGYTKAGPSLRQRHRKATATERKRGIVVAVRAPGRYGKPLRLIKGKLCLQQPPKAVLHAAGYVAAGETMAAAARLAGMKPSRLNKWAEQNASLWSQLREQAAAIVERFVEQARRAPRPAEAKPERPSYPVPPSVEGPLRGTAGEGQTLANFFEKVYRPQRLVGGAPGTVERYLGVIRAFDRFAGRPVHVADLSDELLGGFLVWLIDQGRSPETANSARRHVGALWRFAHRKKLVQWLPDVGRVKALKRLPDAWTLEELGRLLKAAAETPGMVDTVPAGQWWLALLLTLYETGLRVGAVVQLDRPALNLESGWLDVPPEVQKHGCGQKFRLHAETLAVVRSMLSTATGKRLFPWPFAERGPLYKRLRSILNRAGLPHGRRDLFHKVRRTSATHLAAKMGRAAAQDHLGHSAMSVTALYLDGKQIDRVQAADILPRPTIPGRAGQDNQPKPTIEKEQ